MNNKIIFGQYYDSDSWLHRLDPRTKIISLISCVIFLFVIDNIFILLGFTLFLLLLILTTKTPINRFFKSIRMMSYILIFTFIFQNVFAVPGELLYSFDFNLTVINLLIILVVLTLWFFFSKYIKYFKPTLFIVLLISLFVLQYYVDITPLIANYNISIYKESLLESLFIIIRIIDFLFISSLLTLTTKPTEINCALNSLLKPLRKHGVNTGTFSMIISVTLRFIPTLLLEADKVLKSQASRGADFKEINLIQKVSQMVSLIIPLFVITYKKAIDLTYAMEARAYVDNKERSSLYELKYQTLDYITFVLDVCLVVFCIVSRLVNFL
jgi:energy-coupling factor transport system permease protein